MTGTFNIWLSTTNEPIATFDTSFVAFPPSTFTKVFQGTLPAVSGGEMDFFLQSPFLYNPSQGNLMLTVQTFNGAAVGTDQASGCTLMLTETLALPTLAFQPFRSTGIRVWLRDSPPCLALLSALVCPV